MTARTADIAIIGGGAMGCWTALNLARRGRRVVVVERSFVGSQASGVNFGSMRIQGRFLGQLPLALRADALWSRLDALIGSDCEFERTGHVFIAANAAELAQLERYAAEAAGYGLRPDLLDAATLRRRWPWIAPDFVGGSFSEHEGAVNPRLVCPAVAATARQAGAEIIEGAGVATAVKIGSGFRVAAATGVTVEAGILVNMAGAWGPAIAESFGESVPLFAAGPGEIVTEPLPRFMGPTVQTVDGTVVVRQVARGNVLIAGHPRGPADAEAKRARMPATKVQTNLRRAGEVILPLAGTAIIRTWSGIEGYLPDMRPIIGPSATCPGLWHAFGFCGHGMQLGPAVGVVMSELIIDGRSETPLAPFAIGRFRSPMPGATVDLHHEFDDSVLRRRQRAGGAS